MLLIVESPQATEDEPGGAGRTTTPAVSDISELRYTHFMLVNKCQIKENISAAGFNDGKLL